MDAHDLYAESAAEPVDGARLQLIADRLQAVDERMAEFHRRSEHREAVIDRLHSDNELLRQGERRVLLDPVVTDLIRLHDALAREADRLTGESSGPLFESFADDVELILERAGLDVFAPGPGEPFEPGRHSPAGTLPTNDPGLHNTVAKVVGPGFTDRESGRIRRPARVRFWHHRPEPVGSDAPDHTPSSAESE